MSVESDPGIRPDRRGAFLVLFACLVSSGMGNSMTFAILPPLAREIAMPDLWVSFIYTSTATLFLITSQVWGTASDRWGRKPVVVLGLSGFAVSMFALSGGVALALARTLPVLGVFAAITGARAVFGALGSATAPAASAYVADRTAPRERTAALARLTAGFGLGAAIGPAFAAWITPGFGLVAPLVITAIIAVGAAAAASRLPERTPPRETGRLASRTSSWRLLVDPRLSALVLFGVSIWVAQAAGLQTINFYVMDRVGVGGAAAAGYAGAVLTASALAALFAQLVLVPRLKPSPRVAMIAGGGIISGAAVLLASATVYAAIVAGFALMGLGLGLARPGMFAGMSLAVGPEEQGAVAGLGSATAGVGFVTAPAIGLGLYTEIGPSAPYWTLAILALLGTAIAAASGGVRAASARAKDL